MSIDLLLRRLEGSHRRSRAKRGRLLDLGDDALRAAAREIDALQGEVKKLRAERQPFIAVVDAALERGLAGGKCDAAVLELAERLGFRPPQLDLRDLAFANRTVLIAGVRFHLTGFGLDEGPGGSAEAHVTLKQADAPRRTEQLARALGSNDLQAWLTATSFDGGPAEVVFGGEPDPIGGEGPR